MNLSDPTQPVWSIFVMMILLLIGVVYSIVYIMRYDDMADGHNQPEGRKSGSGDSTPETPDRGQREDGGGTQRTSSET